ncbi:MAG: hypothetical protein JWP89_6336 [Schlesneria sp.]|nr:hypothetical protein [Schlesneria sp.]
MDDNNDDSTVYALIAPGSEIAGSAAGAAIGLLGGPVGSVVGSALGPILIRVFRKACISLHNRIQGDRDRIRAGAAVAIAITQINDKLKCGSKLRHDGFFDAMSARPPAAEILEGVIIKSRDEHEERKARFYANIFTTAAFDARFTPDSINYALKTAGQLTYRQLGLLQLCAAPKVYKLRSGSYSEECDLSLETVAVLAEVFELYQRSLLLCRIDDEGNLKALLALQDVDPESMYLAEYGEQLHQLMQLDGFDRNDLSQIAKALQ